MRSCQRAVWVLVTALAASSLRANDLDVAVNEVLYQPPGALANAEYIELHNRGAAEVDVSGWKLTRAVTYTIPNGTRIQAGGFLVVVKDLSLARSLFPGVALVGNFTGSLDDGGERIRLENAQGVVIDEFDYSDDDGWPGEPDGRGASLEKRLPDLDPWFPDSWGPSAALLGTPGRINTQYREIVSLDYIVVGEDWRYLKGTAEPAGDWTSRSFDDASWLVGPTGIGYDDGDDATILSDMQGAYSTVYLRKGFSVADPASVGSLSFSVDYDDGFVVYLNGSEVARRNVGGTPGVPLAFNAIALANRDAGVVEIIDLTADRSLLVAGTNVLAIHVLNASLASTDLSMKPALQGDVEIVGSSLSLSRLVPYSAIPLSSTWSYFKGTAEPSAVLGEWTQRTFADAAWLTGPAGFGYSDNDDATVLSDMINSYSSVYVRKRFTIDDAAAIAGITLGMNYDDGFIAYLNGVEVARSFAPGTAGVFQPRTALATGSHEAGTEESFDLAAHLGLLVTGENVLCVHGFNQTVGSGDFSLHPRLTVYRAVAGDPSALQATVALSELHRPGGGAGWVEIRNGGPAAVDISGYGLSDTAADPLRYSFPSGTLVEAGARRIVSEATMGFSPAAEGALLLTDPQGVVLVDGKRFKIVDASLSVGCFPEGDEDFQALSAPTEGAPNAAPPDRGVVINEIMYHPLTPVGQEELEWVEIHNRTGSPVLLTGWKFTRGIDYAFPAGTTIAAGGYRVIARDPVGVQTRYGITGVLGGTTSRLRNDDEVIVLQDNLENVADRVHYADDGRWPEAADGTGPSAELMNPALDNHTGMAWAASTGEGTPGAPNSALASSVAPIVTRFAHFPAVPRAGQAVTVTAEVAALDPIAGVQLFHRAAGEPTFAQVPMLDDGLSGDGPAGDGVYGVVLPGRALGTVVEFFVEAEATSGPVRLVPPTAPDQCNLYLVADPPVDLGPPTYRVIMTPADRAELESRDVYSDEPLNATFIAGDEIFYRASVRYRGESSRLVTPKSYRVDFPDDEEFDGVRHLNLNANQAQHQHLGMRIFRGADVPASLTRIVRYVFCDRPALTYTRMEEVGEDFLRRYYTTPDGEDNGNLYRGIDDGNLDYRGTNKESYRPNYKKETNEEEDDWADLIDLCNKLTNTPADQFSTVIPTVIDVEEWIRFFAAHTFIGTQEGGIYRDKGDDYYAYRRPSDGRWVLIPWDIDDSFRQPTERLFRPSLPNIRKVLEHPDFSTSYYTQLVRLGGTHFAQDRMQAEIDSLAGLFSQTALDNDSVYVQSRLGFVDSKTNQDFTFEIGSETIVAEGDTWRFFRGTAEPSGGGLEWTTIAFDDSSWETGPSGIGFGDNDDATILADMLGTYTTVYARHEFTVTDPSAYLSLEFAIDYDDGFIAFLNGIEIARANAGAAGTYPAYSAIASGLREAGAAQVFDLLDIDSILVPGTNVLAVVGLNSTIDSSDFSLIPELRTGGVVGEGCPGDRFVTGSQLLLGGLAPVTQTRWVRVNGVDAAYDPFSGAWSYTAPLAGGTQTVAIRVLDKTGAVVVSQDLNVTRVSTIGGTIAEDVTWTKARSPYLVTGSVTVAAGGRLTIEAGCSFWMGPGVTVTVQAGGRLQALGTASEPIAFTRIPCHDNWGFFNFPSTQEANYLAHCEFSYGTASPGCLSGGSCRIEVESCHIRDITGEGISMYGGTVTVRNTLIERTNETMSIDYCNTIIEFNEARNGIGKADLCDCNGSNPPARIAFNSFHGTSDDAIDADNGSVYAEGNIIYSCGDQGISLVGPGNSTIYRNIIYRNNVGLAVKDSHRCLAEFNTYAFNRSYGARAIEKTGGRGGGVLEVKNSIVWGSPTSLMTDSLGALTASYNDLQGTTVGNVTLGAGNISLDPLFVNSAANDYRLRSTSPCIGAAENGDDMGALPYELVPRAPTQLTVTGTTPTTISLQWKDNSAAEESFELERRVSAGFTSQYLVSRGDTFRYFKGRSEPSGGTLDWTAVDFDDGGGSSTFISRGETWKFFRGRSEPSGGTRAWTERVFDDSSWESGPTGIGYGDGDDATVLSDMQNSYTTVYARRQFSVADPAFASPLILSIDYDDGFIAFLNGVEVARSNAGVAGTYPAFNALASASREAGTPQAFDISAFKSALVAGTNVLAIIVLNTPIDSSDLSLIPELRTGGSAWLQGPTGIGYADGDDATILGDMQGQYTTVYLRRAFQVADPSGITALEFIMDYDDGFIAFLNGTEIARQGAGAAGTYPSYNGVATLDHEAGAPITIEVPVSGLLLAGMNVLAIQGLNLSIASTDLTLIPELRTVDETPFQLLATLSPNTRTYVDTGLMADARYSYRVRALNVSGASAYSNVVSVEAGTLPASPTDLAVTAFDSTSITLAWRDNADNEDEFEMERSVAGGEFELLLALPAGSTNYMDTALLPGESYSYRVRAVNAFGPSGYSNVVAQVTGTPPAAPTALAVGEIAIDSIALAWNDNATDETSYELEIRFGAGSFQTRTVLAADTISYVDTELQSGSTYSYRVRAVNAAGPSGYSNEVTATTGSLPDAPDDLTVGTVGIDTIPLSWIDASDDETGFELERKGPLDAGFSLRASLPAGQSAYLDSGLEPGTTYAYRVRALNEYGSSGYSNEVTATTGRLPDAPSGLLIGAIGLDSISLSWLDNADNEQGYELERSESGGAFVRIADLAANSVMFVDTGLSQGTEYAYRVRAVNEYGASAYSAVVSGVTERLPAAPGGLALVSRSHESIAFTWIDNSDNETGFDIERRDSGGPFQRVAGISENGTAFLDQGLQPGTNYVYRVVAFNTYGRSLPSPQLAVTTGRFPDAPTNLAAAAAWLDEIQVSWNDNADNESGFELERRLAEGGAFLKIADLPANAASYRDQGLLPGRAYAYRIRSVNEFGQSAFSAEAFATTPSLPAAPSGLAVTAVGLDRLDLAWSDNADNETGYELERKGPADANFVPLATLPAGTAAYADAGLPSGTEFSYRARAINEYGASDYSATLVAVTGRLPAAPSGLAVTAVGLDRLDLAWSDNADNETGYELERKGPADADFVPLAALPAGTAAYADAGLPYGTEFSYRIRAINVHGASEYSGTVTASTLNPIPEVESVTPAEGPSTGGTDVVITGQNFLPGSTVRLGGAEVVGLDLVSLTEMRFQTPAGARGLADLEIYGPAGPSTFEDVFHYYEDFLRGDSNADGLLNITDPIFLLRYLFQGGEPIPCDDVSDSNTDGLANLSDSIYMLNNLFLGGPNMVPEDARCY